MATFKISKRSVDGLTPVERTKIFYDDELKGFGVRVTATGRKTWIVEYRPDGGGRNAATRRMSLGGTFALTAEEARRKARELLAQARLGFDPARELSENRKAETVEQFAKSFLDRHVKLKLKPNTIAAYETILSRWIVPGIGGTRLRNVTTKQISDLHRKVGQSSPVSANKMLAVLSSMFGFAVIEGLVSKGFNPTQGIERFPERTLERYLSSEEITRIGEAIRQGEATGIPWSENRKAKSAKAKHGRKAQNRITLLDPHTAAAMRLLLLTGARCGEILGLRWQDVDEERALLHLADSKTGPKKIILNGPALAVLRDLPRLGAYVIPGRDPSKPRNNFRRSWQAVLRHAGVKDVRLHDLRHTHASVGVNAGMGLPLVGKLLGHSQVATTQRYAHLGDDPVRNASEEIGNLLYAALEGRNPVHKTRKKIVARSRQD